MQSISKIQLAAALVAAFGLGMGGAAKAADPSQFGVSEKNSPSQIKLADDAKSDAKDAPKDATKATKKKAKDKSCKGKEKSCKGKDKSCKGKEGSCKGKDGSCKGGESK